jgi:pimeloyl-ACP methyl ester carboxylesterase
VNNDLPRQEHTKRNQPKENDMHTSRSSQTNTSASYRDTPTRTVSVDGADFVYRQLGPEGDVPVIFLNHLGAVLDNWDPRLVDGIAAQRRVITFDNRGVGASQGSTPDTIEAMTHDAVAFIRALGLEQVDLLGLSMGGFITQVIAQEEPQLVRKIILAGTGPAGGQGIDKVTSVTIRDMVKAALTFQDAKQFLFFTRTTNGRLAGRRFLERLKERSEDRDKTISLPAFRAQLKAIHRWGLQSPSNLSTIPHPVLLANGESDRMVPSQNTIDLATRLPSSELIPLYPDAGHGGIFQYHDQFVAMALDFLKP